MEKNCKIKIPKVQPEKMLQYDASRPYMACIHCEKGYKVYSNGQFLLKIKADYPKEYEGNNMIPNHLSKKFSGLQYVVYADYPNYDAIIPKKTKFTAKIDLPCLYEYLCNVIQNYKQKTGDDKIKERETLYVPFYYKGKFAFAVDALKAQKWFCAANLINADTLQWNNDSTAVFMTKGDNLNDEVLLMMPLLRNAEDPSDNGRQGKFCVDYDHDIWYDTYDIASSKTDGKTSKKPALKYPKATLPPAFNQKFRKNKDWNFDSNESPIAGFCMGNGTVYADRRFETHNDGDWGWDYVKVMQDFPNGTYTILNNSLPEYQDFINKHKAHKGLFNRELFSTLSRLIWVKPITINKVTTVPKFNVGDSVKPYGIGAPVKVEKVYKQNGEYYYNIANHSGGYPEKDLQLAGLSDTPYTGNGGRKGTTERGILDEYYTPDFVCEFMYALAVKYGYKAGKVLEPSCATGNIIRPIYERNDYTHIDAFEINKTSRDICQKLFPNVKIYDNYFETAFLEPPRYSTKAKRPWLKNAPYDLVIGNPPYGKHVNRYSSYFSGKDKFAQIEMFFMYKCLDLLRSGGLLVFITSTNFMSTGNAYQGAKERIGEIADLVDAYRLPKVFERTDICTDIIVLRKK